MNGVFIKSVDFRDRQPAEAKPQARRPLQGREESRNLDAAIDLSVDGAEPQIRKSSSRSRT